MPYIITSWGSCFCFVSREPYIQDMVWRSLMNVLMLLFWFRNNHLYRSSSEFLYIMGNDGQRLKIEICHSVQTLNWGYTISRGFNTILFSNSRFKLFPFVLLRWWWRFLNWIPMRPYYSSWQYIWMNYITPHQTFLTGSWSILLSLDCDDNNLQYEMECPDLIVKTLLGEI